MGWKFNYVIIDGKSVDPNKFLRDLMNQPKNVEAEKHDVPRDTSAGNSR